jgi:hypothetical protein
MSNCHCYYHNKSSIESCDENESNEDRITAQLLVNDDSLSNTTMDKATKDDNAEVVTED